MSIKLNHGGPAFPFAVDHGDKLQVFTGMTLRDWFARQASEHDLVYYVRLNPAISPAEARWMFADDMLKAREEKP